MSKNFQKKTNPNKYKKRSEFFQSAFYILFMFQTAFSTQYNDDNSICRHHYRETNNKANCHFPDVLLHMRSICRDFYNALSGRHMFSHKDKPYLYLFLQERRNLFGRKNLAITKNFLMIHQCRRCHNTVSGNLGKIFYMVNRYLLF